MTLSRILLGEVVEYDPKPARGAKTLTTWGWLLFVYLPLLTLIGICGYMSCNDERPLGEPAWAGRQEANPH